MSETESESLHRTQRSPLEQTWTFIVRHRAFLYFMIFEGILIAISAVLGFLGEGEVRTGLKTGVDLYTAWSGIFGAIALFLGLTIGLGMLIWILYDVVDGLR